MEFALGHVIYDFKSLSAYDEVTTTHTDCKAEKFKYCHCDTLLQISVSQLQISVENLWVSKDFNLQLAK